MTKGRRIKVLQLQNSYNVNASDLAEQIIQALPTERFDVTTAFLDGRPGRDSALSRAERAIYFELGDSASSGLRLRMLLRLYQHCRKESYDVVIAHRFKPVKAAMLLNRVLRFKGCIGIAHGLGEYDRASRRVLTRLLQAPNWITVGVSRAVRTYLCAIGAGFNETNTVQINNAIDVRNAESAQFDRARSRQLLGIPDDALVFGSIGRLVPVKGHIHLVRAFARICDELPSAIVAIIGDGKSRGNLEQEIAARGLEGRVLLLGAKEDALRYAKAFDVFVMPSRSEGLPLALLEAMSARLPVIGSDIPSLRPILEDCGGGIFAQGDDAALAALLADAGRRPASSRQAEGLRAYNYLRRAHAIEDFRHQYLTLVEEAAS